MASPVAFRQPLAQRTINTAFYPTPTPVSTNTSAATTTAATRPLVKHITGQKRAYSQIFNGQENVRQQILSTVSFKSPTPPGQKTTQLPMKRLLVNAKPGVIRVQPQSQQFKQPLSTPVVMG